MIERDAEADRRDPPRPFVEHLDELRGTLAWSAAAFAAGVALAAPLSPRIVALLKSPLRAAGKDPDTFLKILDVTGGLTLALQVIFWSGLLFSAPLLVFFAARFVFPGLTRRERRAVLGGLAGSVALFALGVGVGYFLLLDVTLQGMFGISEWLGVRMEFIRLDGYVSFVLKLLLGFGLAFEFPVVVLALAAAGLVSAGFLAGKRRHVCVLLLVVAAVVTPTVDPVTQTMLALPLYGLYEVCVWVVWWRERRARRAAAEGG
jgi:sec-independent protein translocase protein TatC